MQRQVIGLFQFPVDDVASVSGQNTVVRPRTRGRPRGTVRAQNTNRPNYNVGWNACVANDSPNSTFVYNDFRPPIDRNVATELEYWQLFFTDYLIDEIVTETNRYAKEKIQKNTPLRKRSVWITWVDVTRTEMKAFLGVVLNMAMNDKTEIRDYFTEDWLDYQPFFKDVFSRERFFQIFWMLHVCAPTLNPNQRRATRGDKVKRIGEYLDSKYRDHYCPGNNVSVDESTVGFKGKIVFKCYNKLKPIKWGLRIYVL